MQIVVALIVGLAIGAGAALLAARRTHAAQTGRLTADIARLESERAEALRRLGEQHAAALQHAQEVLAARHGAALAEARQQDTEARAQLQADLAAAESTVTELRETVESLRQQHADYVTSQRRLQAEREQRESAQAQVLKVIAPVAEELKAMQLKVAHMDQQRANQHGQLAEQIAQTQRGVEESRRAADTLASVLRNNAVRGTWGETQLQTLVESAGLLKRVDFELQRSIEADSGDRRPDMVINLPGGKQMAIDAKAPYNAFMDAQRDGIEPTQRERLLGDHARKVRGHVDALAKKGYWTGLTASPEFTVAFIPNEQLLNAALEVDPSLMEHAFKQGVVLATPTNLWSMLKTVAFTWKQEALTEDAEELFRLGQELYRRIVTLSSHVEKLGRSITRTVKDYNAFTGSLERSVLPSARKLSSADPLASLPAPAEIEETTKALTAGDFAALGDDLDRPEIDLALLTVDAEIITDDADEAV